MNLTFFVKLMTFLFNHKILINLRMQKKELFDSEKLQFFQISIPYFIILYCSKIKKKCNHIIWY